MTGTIITKKGIQLLVKLMATKGELVFNRVGIGIGLLPTGYDPASMIDLVNYKMDGAISRCEADSDVAKITMQVSSIGVETGFTMTEIGIFAEDPDVGEILYSYLDLQEDPQYIYAEGGDAEKYIEITLEVAIEESTKVSAYINPDSLVTRQEFEKQLLNFKEEIKGGLEKIDFDDSGEIEGIESFTDFMSSFVKGTNIYQFFSNLKAGLNYVLHAGQLVNSGMCETPGMFPLDAAFGKTLQDQITGLYSEIAEPKIGFSSLPGMTLWDSNIQKCILFFPVRYFNMEKYNIVPVRAYISGITSSIDENPRLALGGHYIVAYTNVIDPEYEGHYAILQINISHK